jgi:hypothetical protein
MVFNSRGQTNGARDAGSQTNRRARYFAVHELPRELSALPVPDDQPQVRGPLLSIAAYVPVIDKFKE